MSCGRQLRFRRLANVLTASRFPTAALILAAGLTWSELKPFQRLSLIVGLNIFGWTTDLIDGWAARSSGQPSPAWGAVDQAADLLLIFGTAYAVSAAGFAPIAPVEVYFLIAALAVAIRPEKNIGQIVCVPMLLLPVAVCLRYYPGLAVCYLGWAAGAAIMDRRRLFDHAVAFLDRMPAGLARTFLGLRRWLTDQLDGADGRKPNR